MSAGGPNLTRGLLQLADLRRQQGRLEEATQEIERIYKHLRERNAEKSWHMLVARSVHGAVLSAEGRRSDAEPLLREAFDDLRRVAGDRSPWTSKAHARLIDHYEAHNQAELAEETRALIRQP